MRHRRIGPEAPRDAQDRGLGLGKAAARRQGEAFEQDPFIRERQKVDGNKHEAGERHEQHRRRRNQTEPREAHGLAEQTLVEPPQGADGPSAAGFVAGRLRLQEAECERDEGQRYEERGQKSARHGKREGNEEQARKTANEHQRQEDGDDGDGPGDVGAGDPGKAAPDAGPAPVALLPAVIDALEHDDRVVRQNADRDAERAEGHQIEALAQGIKPGDAEQQRQRDADRECPDGAPGAQNPEQHQDRKRRAEQQIAPEIGADDADQISLIVDIDPADAGRHLRQRRGKRGSHRARDLRTRRTRLFQNRERDAGQAVEQGGTVRRYRPARDPRERFERDRPVSAGDRDPPERGRLRRRAACLDQHVLMPQRKIAGGAQHHLLAQRRDDGAGGDAVMVHRLKIRRNP